MIMTKGSEFAEVKNEVQAAAFKNEGWEEAADVPKAEVKKPRKAKEK